MATTEPWTIERGDPAYPPSLHDLDHLVDAGTLLTSEGACARLHGCGSRDLLAGLAPGAAVTIVGARRCTPYGRAVSAEIAGSLAAAGLVVISGMAYGIDSAAHRGALDAGGLTIAVMAGGPDIPYPASARKLHARLLRGGGAVVSESPPGHRPARWQFPARNRIMAALAAMTVVVEATERSGSRITARYGLWLGRTVGAVPGSIHSPLSAGPHALVRDGGVLVTSAQDVLDCVLGVGAASARRLGPPLDDGLAEVLELVGAEGTSCEGVAAGSPLPAAQVAVSLSRLELLGYLRAETGRYARTGLIPP